MGIKFDTMKLTRCAVTSMLTTAAFIAGVANLVKGKKVNTVIGLAVATITTAMTMSNYQEVLDSIEFKD